MKAVLSIIIVILTVTRACAAEVSGSVCAADSVARENPYRFGWRQLIVPGALIAVGTVGMEAKWFRGLNHETEPGEGSGTRPRTPVDDVMEYVPMAGLYALKLCGVKSRHDYVEGTLLLAMSWAISAAGVQGAKHLFPVWRPDGTKRNSFPSGHTATAFMGAELLRQEFKDASPWIGYAGYAVAVATGALRVCHDRHWLTDVLAGAGIGILSTRVAYWIYPFVTRHIFPPLYRRNVYLSAFGGGSCAGVSLAYRF